MKSELVTPAPEVVVTMTKQEAAEVAEALYEYLNTTKPDTNTVPSLYNALKQYRVTSREGVVAYTAKGTARTYNPDADNGKHF